MTSHDQPADRMEHLASSLIQHGPANRRIYLMKLGEETPEGIAALIERLHDMAHANGYTKIFAKIPSRSRALFLEAGYREEAVIPAFYQGRHAASLLGYYLDPARAHDEAAGETAAIEQASLAKASSIPAPDLPDGYRIHVATPADAEDLAELYRQVFASYPFPIFEPAYLRETMATHIIYFIVRKDGQAVGASSAETSPDEGNAEMTDFAVLPSERGRKLALNLLEIMEQELVARALPTAFTIARARSGGMNITFARKGYTFAGRLINNTQIVGRIESMNVWYKSIIAP